MFIRGAEGSVHLYLTAFTQCTNTSLVNKTSVLHIF